MDTLPNIDEINQLLLTFKSNKLNNQIINWKEYLVNNNDLHFMKDLNQLIKHWITYGIKENRKYDKISNISEWSKIYSYLNTNYYKYNKWAFIITTCIKKEKHINYLKKCIESIRQLYNEQHIYIINDNSDKNYDINEIINNYNNIEVIESIVSGGGEINPYLFILDEKCKYDKLVYIHDTVFIKENIDYYINLHDEIIFLWYSNHAIFNDTINKIENKEIFDNFYLYFSDRKIGLTEYFNILKKYRYFDVKFGSMAIITKRFMEKVDLISNFVETSKYFRKRINRSFLERLLTILYLFIYGQPYDINKYICGSINRHPDSFLNSNPDLEYYIKKDNKLILIPYKPLVKVWQGR